MEYQIVKNAKIISVNSEFAEKNDYCNLRGLCVETNKGNIKILISDDQSCCEDADSLFLETPDSIEKFIGAIVLKIEDICIGLTADKDGYGFDEGGETQLKITTNKGVLQYAVYNHHNGYYSHATFVQVFDDITEGYL